MTKLHYPGDLIHNRYQVHSLIGQGGTGETYQAEDVQQHQWVALKVMSLKQLGTFDLLDRFEREAEILGTIDHPGVPDYIEHFRVETDDDCRFYLAQEFASGKSLDRWVHDGWRATEAEVQRIALEILTTLEYLHGLEAPIIHRDIKPQNIIRQSDGRIYLVDFGAVQSAYRDQQVSQGTFIGTLGYMPPEQLRGQATFASDLYALGATLVFLLTHRNPDELPMQRMKIHFQGRVKLSAMFSLWLDRMLEPRLKHRFASAKAARMGLQTAPVFPESIHVSADNVEPSAQTSLASVTATDQELRDSTGNEPSDRSSPWMETSEGLKDFLLGAVDNPKSGNLVALLYCIFWVSAISRLLIAWLGILSIALMAWFLAYVFDNKLKEWIFPLAFVLWLSSSVVLLSLIQLFILLLAVVMYVAQKHKDDKRSLNNAKIEQFIEASNSKKLEPKLEQHGKATLPAPVID